MMSPIFLEFNNALLIVVLLSILIFFGFYIAGGIIKLGFHEGRKQREAAIGVFVFMLGDFFIRSSVWWWQHNRNQGIKIKHSETWSASGTAIGVILCIIGGVCIVRCFAPAQLKDWPTAFTLTAALAFALAVVL